MGGNLRYVRNVFISYVVCMYVTAPCTVHSMYPQHVSPLQLLCGEECSNAGLLCILLFACSANILHFPVDCPDSICAADMQGRCCWVGLAKLVHNRDV
jgi:hypothetical protein